MESARQTCVNYTFPHYEQNDNQIDDKLYQGLRPDHTPHRFWSTGVIKFILEYVVWKLLWILFDLIFKTLLFCILFVLKPRNTTLYAKSTTSQTRYNNLFG